MLDFLFGQPRRRQPASGRRQTPRGTGRQRIVVCVYEGIPYEFVQYLESLGVKVWPTHHIYKQDDGTMEAAVLVNAAQFAYAAGLIGGYPGCRVLIPHPVKAIKPRTRWGKTNNSARGILTSTLRPFARLWGVAASKPPMKGKR